MASNDIEVLDPAATVEKIKKIASGVVVNRRHFMAALGLAGAAAGTSLVSGTPAVAQEPLHPSGYSQIDVLNFLLQIKYLTATLYSYITQGADLPGTSGVTVGTGQIYNTPSQITFSNQQITDFFNEMYYDELNHLIDLRNLIATYSPSGTAVGGTAVAARGTINLAGTSAVNTTFAAPAATQVLTQAQAIGLARLLEDLSVQAFAGASSYLTGANLQYAAQVLAADGVHAGAVRLLSIQTGAPYQGVLQATSFQVGTTLGSNTVTAISTIPAALAVGQPLSGTGIPSGAVVTGFTSTAAKVPTGVVIKNSNVITSVSSTAGLLPGQPITGTDIPALTYITAVGTTTITLSQNVTATPAAAAPTGILTFNSATITNVSSLTGLATTQPITGTNIPANTTIVSFTGTTIVMSAPANASSLITLTGNTTTGSPTISGVSSINGLVTGTLGIITGTGIPGTTTYVKATAPGTITLSANATTTSSTATGVVTAGSNTITGVSSTSGLATGMGVTGTGVAPSTTITAISAGTVTLSAVPTASSVVVPTGTVTSGSTSITNVSSLTGVQANQPISGAGIPTGATIVSAASGTIVISAAATASGSAIVLTCVTTETITFGAILTAVTTQSVSSPSTETITIGQSLITLSTPATVTGSTTAIAITADSFGFDVAPVDPGNAAAAAAGPTANATSYGEPTPITVFQGFFDTASATSVTPTSATAATPPGFAFARTFSQTLSVLYASTTTNTYEGGFYPVGVTGTITVV